jgi:ATP-dependent phosphofructokinase / diphosphate-dependent phosphofructokinase
MIANEFGWRGEFQVSESLPMCAADRGTKFDFVEAYACGQQAVKLAARGEGGVMVTLRRVSKPGEPYRSDFGTISLSEAANHARPMPDRYITKDGFGVTKAFLDYAAPLVGELPAYVSLAARRAKP